MTFFSTVFVTFFFFALLSLLCVRLLLMKDLLDFIMQGTLLLLWCICGVLYFTGAQAGDLDLALTFIWMTFIVFVLLGSVLWVRVLKERSSAAIPAMPGIEDEVSP